MTDLWERVDFPVLQWVHLTPPDDTGYLQTGELYRTQEPAAELPQLTQTELDEALVRLKGHGLIAGERYETSDYAAWWKLRPTA